MESMIYFKWPISAGAFSKYFSKSIKTEGMTNRVILAEARRPQTITVAMGLCTSDPIPVASEAGNSPKIATTAVMITGLNLSLAASKTVDRKLIFCSDQS